MPEEGKQQRVTPIFRFFRSIKLAIVLLLVITAGSIIATLIPQGKDISFYQAAYGQFTAQLVTALSLDKYFRSIYFFLPVVLFFVNLGVCSVDRFVRRIKSGSKKRFGPDILHLGLLILTVGAVISFSGRREGYFTFSEGETVSLPDGYEVTLLSFAFLTYENGTPRDWISTVTVKKNANTVVEASDIEVNKPLKIGRMKLYQSSYGMADVLTMTDDEGVSYDIGTDTIIPNGEESLIFRKIEPAPDTGNAGVFDIWKDHKVGGTVRLGPGETAGEYRIDGFSQNMFTGLQVVIDPGYRVVFIALLLIIIGLALTYLQKIGDSQQ